MKQNKIVVVEDETDIRELIEHNLQREGFLVETASTGEDALKIVRATLPHLVLLDLMIPGIDGIEVCRTLKGDSSTLHIPIIMVTAKGEESDIVLGLGIGADDYMTKPFSPKEMLARIKAVLRRGEYQNEKKNQERLVVKDVVIDTSRHEVLVAGVPVVFTATEFNLLYYMASRPGRVFTRSHLLSSVIGEDVFIVERNIDVHIRSLRKKLGNSREMIETVRGVGYRFRDHVE
ncbi:Phosphate regulon transcriptional regulatory protein PhoB (SphR) [hydrothermal vent metagenome]|uniref:Phosphate regulon transcriptional regulatory protein PhoB (SphR) n=1 Tax=hydrothermal vent metagenome TaxID=652676 RepID=A0A3B1DIS5_9ZZZZ